MMDTRDSIVIGIIAVAGIFVLMLLESNKINKRLVNGFQNPIIAIEFINSGQDLDSFTEMTDREKDAIRNHTRLDFAFILAYGILLISLVMYLVQNRLVQSFLITLVLTACASDAVENVCLLKALSPSFELFSILQKAVYMKWALICFVVATLSFWQIRKWVSSVAIAIIILLFFMSLWILFICTSSPYMPSCLDVPATIERILLIHILALGLLLLRPLWDLILAVRLILS